MVSPFRNTGAVRDALLSGATLSLHPDVQGSKPAIQKRLSLSHDATNAQSKR